MANWNADFTGYPKALSNGDIFGSDKAPKYPMKKMWEAQGEKILYVKSYKVDKGDEKKNKNGEINLRPKSLRQRYDEIFETNLKETKDKTEVIKNLFNAADVKNFWCNICRGKKQYLYNRSSANRTRDLISMQVLMQKNNKYFLRLEIQVKTILKKVRLISLLLGQK